MKNVLAEITRLRLERGWNEYELAKHCGLSQSTISTWYRKNQTPTIQTLDKVCKGLGISLSQFFAEGSDAVSLTPEQKDMLDNWSALNIQQKQIIRLILRTLNWFQCQGQFFDSNRYKITTVTGEKSVSTAWPPY